jgi:hypothetical protein
MNKSKKAATPSTTAGLALSVFVGICLVIYGLQGRTILVSETKD